MRRFIFAAAIAAAMSVSGCTSVDASLSVRRASELAAQRTGRAIDWSSSPPAASQADAAEITLDAALDRALRNNRALRVEIATIGQAQADLVQAGLLTNPSLNFMIMFPDGGGRSMLRGNGLPMQALQDLWLIPARENVAKARLERAILQVAHEAVRTASDVSRTYAQVQYAQRAVELLSETIKVLEESTDIVRAQQTAGQATQSEVNLAYIRALRLRSELMTMQMEQAVAQRELLALTGDADAPAAWRVSAWHELDDAIATPPDEAAAVAAALSQRLDLQAAEWDAGAAERRLTLTQREALPDVAVGVGFERSPMGRENRLGWRGQAGNIAVQEATNRALGMPMGSGMAMPTPFRDDMDDVDYTIGPMLELELPIFDQNQAQIARADFELQQARAALESRQQDTTQSVRSILARQRQAYEQVRFYRERILPEVARNLELARQSYVAGQENLTVYFQATEDVIMTRLKLLSFVRDYHIAAAEFIRAVGGVSAAIESAAGERK